MKRAIFLVIALVVLTNWLVLPGPAAPAAEALVAPVLPTTRAAPAEVVQVGLKAARPGVVITAATVRPRDLPQFVLPLNDSGMMGDAAGDGVWSISFPVPDGVPPGFYYLDYEAQVTVEGQAQTATASIQVEITKGEGRSVQIVMPRRGATLLGSVTVAAKVATMYAPARVVCCLGPLMVDMKPRGDLWTATLDTTRVRNGRQRLVVVTSAAGTGADPQRQQAGALAIAAAVNAHAEIPVTVRNPYQYYWGDMHAHTIYSDGVKTPADAYAHARDVAHLDFFALTDHDAQLTFDEYDDMRRQANAFDQPGVFAALYGVEWTTDAGHMCFYMAERFRLAVDLESAYRELGELGIAAHFNHPARHDFNWHAFAPQDAGMIYAAEVRSASEEASYIAMLNHGWRVGADGSQDKHDETWGEGPHWTVALAPSLSRDSILDALRARRIYSTYDRNMRLDFSLDGEDMGAAVSREAGALPLVVNVTDPDPNERVTLIEAVMDGRVAARVAPNAATYHWRTRLHFAPGRHYVYLRITQADGNRAWSSPIWVWARRPSPTQP